MNYAAGEFASGWVLGVFARSKLSPRTPILGLSVAWANPATTQSVAVSAPSTSSWPLGSVLVDVFATNSTTGVVVGLGSLEVYVNERSSDVPVDSAYPVGYSSPSAMTPATAAAMALVAADRAEAAAAIAEQVANGQILLSVDPGNQATFGSDQRLFVPAPQLSSAQW